MAEYITKIMSKVRQQESLLTIPKKEEVEKLNFLQTTDNIAACESDKIENIILHIKNIEVEGEKKRLIRIDDENEKILKMLQPIFGLEVTQFANFVFSNFFKNNPEIIAQIKKTYKKL